MPSLDGYEVGNLAETGWLFKLPLTSDTTGIDPLEHYELDLDESALMPEELEAVMRARGEAPARVDERDDTSDDEESSQGGRPKQRLEG